jgi:hypothetical protein
MADHKVWGIDRDLWEATHDAGIDEHPATRFFLTMNGPLVRLVFGINGPPLDEKGAFDVARFHVAVSMPPAMAVELRNTLNQWIERQQAGATSSPTEGEKATLGNGQGEMLS